MKNTLMISNLIFFEFFLLTQITSEEEWTMLEEMLDDYYNNQENGCGGSCESCSGCDETIED